MPSRMVRGEAVAPQPPASAPVPGALAPLGGDAAPPFSHEGEARPLCVTGSFVYYGRGRHEDSRGFYEEITLDADEEAIVRQSGYAVSQSNVLRGMHCSPYGKIVVCLAGEMWDAIVDLRPGSPTYLCWDAVALSPERRTRLYVPPGVAHGYLALKDGTLSLYLKLGCFDKAQEIEVNARDPALGIPWPAPLGGASDYIMSAKDSALPAAAQVLPPPMAAGHSLRVCGDTTRPQAVPASVRLKEETLPRSRL